MTQDAIQELTLRVVELIAMLKERCPQHAKDIEKNANDIDHAFSRIRKDEIDLKEAIVALSKEMKEEISVIKVTLAKWGSIIGIILLGLNTIVVKFFSG